MAVPRLLVKDAHKAARKIDPTIIDSSTRLSTYLGRGIHPDLSTLRKWFEASKEDEKLHYLQFSNVDGIIPFENELQLSKKMRQYVMLNDMRINFKGYRVIESSVDHIIAEIAGRRIYMCVMKGYS